jgi:RNA 2',3'-cyclic 3'-phosphodiesterase
MEAESPRLFIAVPIDELWREQLIKQSTMLQLKLPFQKWTHPEDYHITLKFLGDTSTEKIQQIQRKLLDLSGVTRSFELTEKGWGAFGPHAVPSLLWAGVGGDLTSLLDLQKKVDSSMAELGYPPEDRAFHPHLTIARRYKGKGPLSVPIKQYFPEETKSLIRCSVKEIILYQSNLSKKPMYEALASYKLIN